MGKRMHYPQLPTPRSIPIVIVEWWFWSRGKWALWTVVHADDKDDAVRLCQKWIDAAPVNGQIRRARLRESYFGVTTPKPARSRRKAKP